MLSLMIDVSTGNPQVPYLCPRWSPQKKETLDSLGYSEGWQPPFPCCTFFFAWPIIYTISLFSFLLARSNCPPSFSKILHKGTVSSRADKNSQSWSLTCCVRFSHPKRHNLSCLLSHSAAFSCHHLYPLSNMSDNKSGILCNTHLLERCVSSVIKNSKCQKGSIFVRETLIPNPFLDTRHCAKITPCLSAVQLINMLSPSCLPSRTALHFPLRNQLEFHLG